MMRYFLCVFICLFLTYDSLLISSYQKDLPIDIKSVYRDWDRYRIYFYHNNYWKYDWDRHLWLPVYKPFDVEYMEQKAGKWVKVVPENSMMIP